MIVCGVAREEVDVCLTIALWNFPRPGPELFETVVSKILRTSKQPVNCILFGDPSTQASFVKSKSCHEFSCLCYFQCSQTNWSPKLSLKSLARSGSTPAIEFHSCPESKSISQCKPFPDPPPPPFCPTLGCPSHSFPFFHQTFHVVGWNPLQLGLAEPFIYNFGRAQLPLN